MSISSSTVSAVSAAAAITPSAATIAPVATAPIAASAATVTPVAAATVSSASATPITATTATVATTAIAAATAAGTVPAATTAIPTVPSAAATRFVGFFHGHFLPADGRIVQCFNSSAGFGFVGHVHKAEAFTLPRLPIHHDLRKVHCAVQFKHFFQVYIVKIIGKTCYKKLHAENI